MSEDTGKIAFTTEEGEELSFFVVEQTQITGKNYLLVTDSLEDESEAYIMREVAEADGQSFYEFLEDESELDAMAKVFEELLEDTELEV